MKSLRRTTCKSTRTSYNILESGWCNWRGCKKSNTQCICTLIYKINIDSVYCLGDIHGSLKSIAGHIKRYDLKNCALIFCGDIGFGFEKTEYFKQIYRKLHPLLSPNNIYCYFVRGNHDNPDLFNGKKIPHKRFVAIEYKLY